MSGGLGREQAEHKLMENVLVASVTPDCSEACELSFYIGKNSQMYRAEFGKSLGLGCGIFITHKHLKIFYYIFLLDYQTQIGRLKYA